MSAEHFGSGYGVRVCVKVVVSSEAGVTASVTSADVMDFSSWQREAWAKEKSMPVRKKRWLCKEMRC